MGVIAARFDNVVSASSTHLEGELDHTVVPCRHGMLPFGTPAVEQTISFLNRGCFAPSLAATRDRVETRADGRMKDMPLNDNQVASASDLKRCGFPWEPRAGHFVFDEHRICPQSSPF